LIYELFTLVCIKEKENKETYSSYTHCSVYYSGNLRFSKAATGEWHSSALPHLLQSAVAKA